MWQRKLEPRRVKSVTNYVSELRQSEHAPRVVMRVCMCVQVVPGRRPEITEENIFEIIDRELFLKARL